MKLPLLGYAPDADPQTPGVIADCVSFISSQRGMEAAPAPVATPLAALASTCYGIATFRKLDSSSVTVAGTATKIYLAGTASWSDVSGTAYGASTNNRWSFCQYGDVTLAANKADTIQARTGANFANVSGSAPKAAFIETVNQFIFAANVNDGADKPDGWACSALGDYTNWTPSIATQAANGRLTDTPGPITGLRRLNDSIVIYKRKAIYVGSYVGPDIIWSFQQSSADVGALNNNSIVFVDYAHYFMGENDFYIFDGTRPIPFGQPVKETVYAEIDKSSLNLCMALADYRNSRIYFYYPSVSNSGYANKCVVYNYRTKRWGRDDQTVSAAGMYVSPGMTYGDVGTYYTTYADLPNAPYGLAFSSSAVEQPAIVDNTNVVKTLTGTPGTTSFRLSDLGSDQEYVTVTRVQPRFLKPAATATLVNYYKTASGAPYTEDQSVAMQNYRFDLLRSARWHSANLTFSGTVDVEELDIQFERDGME